MDKIILCFKCPDAKFNAVKNYVDSVEDMDDANGCKREDWVYDDLEEEVSKKLEKWVKWDEIVMIEINLKDNTAKVCQTQ